MPDRANRRWLTIGKPWKRIEPIRKPRLGSNLDSSATQRQEAPSPKRGGERGQSPLAAHGADGREQDGIETPWSILPVSETAEARV
jgi:hypothetical protein